MLFHLDEDKGDRIAGWVVPDNPTAASGVVAVIDGRTRTEIAATELRPLLKAGNVHSTGLCGFVVDAATCPGLTPDTPLELYETHSNVLIYRRPRPGTAPLRIFNLETQTNPAYPVVQALSPHMQMSYGSVEFVAEEALVSILGNAFCGSVLVSGAVAYRRYASHLKARDFVSVVMLGDPHREVAAALLRLKSLAWGDGARAGWRSLGQGGLIDAFASVDITDPAALGRAIRGLRDEDFYALANPTTRKLVARSPTEPIEARHVGSALDVLAEFSLIGFDDDPAAFASGLETLIGRTGLPRAILPEPPLVGTVAEALASCRPARDLLDLDRDLVALAHRVIGDVQPVPEPTES